MLFYFSKTKVLENLNLHGITYQTLDINGLERKQALLPEEPCPIFTKPHHRRRRKRATDNHHDHHDSDDYYILRDDDKIHVRMQLVPIQKFYPTYVIWTSNIPKVKLNFY